MGGSEQSRFDESPPQTWRRVKRLGESRVTSNPMVIIGMKLKEAHRFKIHFQDRTWLMMDIGEDRFLGTIY